MSLALRVGLFACAFLILAWGLSAMLAPRMLSRFTEWYSMANRWSRRRASARGRGWVSYRVAGFLATLMGVEALRIMVSLARKRKGAPLPPSAAVVPSYHWTALVVGLVVLAFGIYMALRPHVLVQWTERNFPDRQLSEDAIRGTLRGGRVGGALTALFGLYLLFLWHGWMR